MASVTHGNLDNDILATREYTELDVRCKVSGTFHQFLCPYHKINPRWLFKLLVALGKYGAFPEWTRQCNQRDDLFCRVCHSNCRVLASTLEKSLGSDYEEFLTTHGG